ncbi:hypothetical protein F4821DRAFT_250494 [Hypoxylon rubiginosum]|uniref:Uncharacterized protein n=1 Tax=Hypoxylon rubiginosum TaxID=110542 RepID=A0ACC0CKP9_9PEZI|nr:hypothetical protein F4821DRAFT_250494 [Hypoxylon rubiginosum]
MLKLSTNVSLKHELREHPNQLGAASKLQKLDDGRVFGLKQVFPSPDDVNATNQKTIDIFILHGLSAKSEETWIAWKEYDVTGSGDVNWTSDANMLPEAMPEARVMTYDWNADYDRTASSDIFLGHADTLLDRIHINRKKTKRLDRPIIFVASCFGGLLLAKALVRATDLFPLQGKLNFETLRQVVGVTFLGTPFRGNWKAGYEAASLRLAIAQNAAAEEGVEYSKELIQYLQLGTPGHPGPLAETVRRFTEMVSNHVFKFPIVCFYETRHTKFKAVLAKLPQDYVQAQIKEDGHGIVVEESSACLDGAERVALDVRHNMLHKFNSPDDDGFQRLSSRLSIFAENAGHIIRAKGNTENFL